MRNIILLSWSMLMATSLNVTPAAAYTLETLDQHLLNQEASVPKVMDGAQKQIRWFGETKEKRPIAVLYFHGYSSSRQEIDPVPQLVADALEANLFYTRFKGHGIEGGAHAFQGVSFEDWLADAQEALAIAQTLGEQVVIIAHSNGAVMAMHLMKEHPQAILAALFVAPNFRPKNAAAELLTHPLGFKLGTMIYKDSLYSMSDSKEFVMPPNVFPNVWSKSQHLDATRALAIGVKQLRSYPFEQMHVPMLILLSDHDQVVDSAYTKKIFARYGKDTQVIKELHIKNNTNTLGEHTITGQYKAPQTSQEFASIMLNFIQKLKK